MQALVLVLIVVATAFPYVVKIGLLPGSFAYLQELLAAVVLLCVVVVGAKERFRFVRPAYWIVFAFLVFSMACGIFLNHVQPGPVFAGLRTYLRAIPLFFLPAIFAFSERQIRTQLRLILALSFLQFPLALYQRMQPGVTGDAVSGTLLISSFMSLFLIGGACVLTGLYVRNRLRLWPYIWLLLLILAPATINETKGTLIFVPLGILAAFIFGAPAGPRFGKTVAAVVAVTAFLAVFIPVYDYTQKDVPGYSAGITAFFAEGQAEKYVSKDTTFGADQLHVGRLDAVRVPFEYLARDPIHLAFGLGIGNVSQSSLGFGFTGKYFQLFDPFLQHTLARLLLETGLFGVSLVVGLMMLIINDSRRVADSDAGLIGAVAAGWIGVGAITMLTMVYKDTMGSAALSLLFWYFSGIIAAHRVRLAFQASEQPNVLRSAGEGLPQRPAGKQDSSATPAYEGTARSPR